MRIEFTDEDLDVLFPNTDIKRKIYQLAFVRGNNDGEGVIDFYQIKEKGNLSKESLQLLLEKFDSFSKKVDELEKL